MVKTADGVRRPPRFVVKEQHRPFGSASYDGKEEIKHAFEDGIVTRAQACLQHLYVEFAAVCPFQHLDVGSVMKQAKHLFIDRLGLSHGEAAVVKLVVPVEEFDKKPGPHRFIGMRPGIFGIWPVDPSTPARCYP